MLKVAIRFGLVAAAVLLAFVVGEYALFVRPTATSLFLGAAGAVILAAGFYLGKQFFSRSGGDVGVDSATLEDRLASFDITEREFEVLKLVAQGLSNQEIGDRLFIAESTVKTHVSSLLTKLDARRRTEAVNRAQEFGILP